MASTANPQGGMALDTLANDHADIQPSKSDKGCKAQEAQSHARGHKTPSIASGVTTKLTQGMASTLANKPTSDT
jgi:hypothetical protein